MDKYDVQKSIEAQRKYCKEKGYPHFAPRNGICLYCSRQIYETGITTERAGSTLITGCPYCNKSYCD
jgi:hypothetical protein